MSSTPPPKKSRTESLAWVSEAQRKLESIVDPAWFDEVGPLDREIHSWETIPATPFTFTVPANADTYRFQYQDGSPDVDDNAASACAGAWDQNVGTHRQHGWVGLRHFDYIVTRKENDGPIAIEARLVSTPLELATTLLQHRIRIDELDQ